MEIINVKYICAVLLVAITLTGTSCSREKISEKVTTPPVGKITEEFKKGVEQSKKFVISRVNGSDITMNNLINEMNRIAPRFVNDVSQRTPEIDNKVKREALAGLIFRELAVQEAVKQGMKAGPEVVEQAMKQLKANLGSEDNYRKYLETAGHSEASFNKQIEKDELLKMITAREIIQKVKVNEKLVRDTYNKEKATYDIPESFAVEDVLIPVGKDAETSMKKAKEILALIRKNNNDISKISQDKSFFVRNGNVSNQEYPNIYQAAAKMKSGELSAIIKEEDGLHIVKFLKKVPPQTLSFEEAKGDIERKLMQPFIEKRKAEWERGLKKNARIEIMLAEVEKKIKEEKR
jgi:parvulin-like peptidyl-prolyl isomerase